MKGIAWLRRRFERDTGGVAIFALVVLCLLYFFDEFDTAAFGVLAPDIERSFHLTDQKFVGLIVLNVGLLVLLAVPVGYLADRVRRTPLVVLSGILAGVFSFATGIVGLRRPLHQPALENVHLLIVPEFSEERRVTRGFQMEVDERFAVPASLRRTAQILQQPLAAPVGLRVEHVFAFHPACRPTRRADAHPATGARQHLDAVAGLEGRNDLADFRRRGDHCQRPWQDVRQFPQRAMSRQVNTDVIGCPSARNQEEGDQESRFDGHAPLREQQPERRKAAVSSQSAAFGKHRKPLD